MSKGQVRSTVHTPSVVELFHTWEERCSSSSNNLSSIGGPKSNTEMQDEARSFFTTLSSHELDNTYETTIASLIQCLNPCFDSEATLTSKYLALSCLVGSLQGCVENAEASCLTSILSLSSVKLVGTFLLSLTAPIESKSNSITDFASMGVDISDVYDVEEIRDLAVSGLIALMRCSVLSRQNTPSSDNATFLMDDETANDLIQLQLSLVCRGVNVRCSLELSLADSLDRVPSCDEYGFEYTKPLPTVEAGLSMLPRARRSICFNLLQAAVDSWTILNRTPLNRTIMIKSATKDCIFDFMTFVTKCLHGESDPRCLLQLLQLIYSSLGAFYPFLNTNSDRNYSNNILIISNVFEAVSPYYPVQFNPPPNDVHGITRSSLRESILRVLSCSLYDIPTHEDFDDNMTSLTCRLIFDYLDPPEEDGPISFKEQIELLEDLQDFLFVPSSEKNNVSNLEKLNLKQIEIVSNGLRKLLEKASFAVVSNGKDSVPGKVDVTAKNLADLCRSLIAKIANKTENMASTDKWHIFVENPVRTFSAQLTASINRAPIAYLACLASFGGLRTLNLCLATGLPPLLKFLKNPTQSTDTDLFMIAIFGLGAFFSSCRVAIEKAASEGIHWYPHPLEPFCNESLDLTLEYLLHSTIVSTPWLRTTDVQVAATRALESILSVFPIQMITTNQSIQLIEVFQQLSQMLLNAENSSSLYDPAVINTLSQALGTFLGLSLHFERELSNDPPSSKTNVFQLETLRKFFVDKFLPSLLVSACREIASSAKYVLLTLDSAASYSLYASSYLIQQLAASLHSALVSGDFENAEALGGVLGFLFEKKNSFATQAFINLCSPNITLFDILAAFAPESQVQSKNVEAFLGMSALQLPTSCEDRQQVFLELEKAYVILKHLRKGYEGALSTDQLMKLFTLVDQVLPPLCDSDAVMLSLILPFLSAALECTTDIESCVGFLEKQLPAMIRDLTEFAMAVEYHPLARSYSARCIHSAIAHLAPRTWPECPIHGLIKNQMIPALHVLLSTAGKAENNARGKIFSPVLLQENLNMYAMFASASAYRGGKSFKTADAIVYFLIDIACQKSDIRIGDFDEGVFDFTELYLLHSSGDSGRISLVAASAFGSVLSTQCTDNVLWKQRLIFLSLKRVIACHAYLAEEQDNKDQAPIGLLCVLSHLVCWSSLSNVSATYLASMCAILTTSLSVKTLQAAESFTIRLFLAAIIKFICMVPSSIRNFYPFIVGAIRAFASVDESPDGILCKLLALQVLSLVAQIGESNVKAYDTVKAIRPAVLSLLRTATDHPSPAVRSAVIEVRNTWYVVEA